MATFIKSAAFLWFCLTVFFSLNITVEPGKLIQQIESFAHSGMVHSECVEECQKLIHGLYSFLCDSGCTTYVYIVNILKWEEGKKYHTI
jgi:hypothetical protein